MSVSFQPDNVLPKDPAGFGRWLTGHYYEHQQFIPLCAALDTPVAVPDFDILSWNDDPDKVQQWLVSHESIHSQIRYATNVTGEDLSLTDWSNDEQFSIWMDNHAQEHAVFREILGVT